MSGNDKMSVKDMQIRRAIGLALSAVLAVLTFYVLPKRAYEQLAYGVESPRWARVEGRVLDSGVKSTAQPRSDSSRPARSTYEPLVTYEYVADGRRYEGRRHRWHPMAATVTTAQGVASAYRAGEAIVIFHKPGQPSVSVIEPGITMGEAVRASIAFLVGIAVFLLLLWVLARDVRNVSSKLRART